MANRNVDVQKLGQSFWYDNIQRGIIANGELRELIGSLGVVGITSNPAIFEKAIGQSSDYDEQLLQLAAKGKNTQEIYEALAIKDIQDAADLLEPIYEQSQGLDGYISLEVNPLLAHDTQGTIDEARRLHSIVARKNLMVKVPATEAGIPAIQQLIEDGININVTLIFSLENYEAVALAFVNGLSARAKQNLPLNVASVASFFVSRVDTLVDKLLDEKIAQAEGARDKQKLEALKSKAAIANAKLAYEVFERVFAGKAWDKLSAAGARPQRVLWASTSTKNPALPDTYYADALIGKDTVNTLPPITLKAFADHGTVAATLKKGLKDAHSTMDKLTEAGVNMSAVWEKLQDDGVDLFGTAFKTMLASVDGKRAALSYQACISGLAGWENNVNNAVRMKAATRIWKRDASLWSKDPVDVNSINTRLGWLNSVQLMQQNTRELKAFVEDVKQRCISDVVVLGMGGSSLAPDMFRMVFPSGNPAITGNLTVHVLDTTDPTTINNLRKRIDPCQALYIVASKSGGTVEVTSFYSYFRSLMDECAGEQAGKHFVAITDEGTKLQSMSTSEGFHRTFINPSDIGGRYSALSYFGLVPAALMGADIDRILGRAAAMASACGSDSALNPGLALGAIMGEAAKTGRDKLCLLLSPQIAAFGAWAEQLIAESTGKRGLGVIPVDGDLGGLKGPFGNDRLFIHMRLEGDTTHEKAIAQLKRDGQPVIEITLRDCFDIGSELFRWEFATAVAGAMLGLNPFDEPNVTESKVNTRRLLDEYVESGSFSSEATSRNAYGQINKFLRSANIGDYISLQCYLPYSDKLSEMLEKLREKISQTYSVPVTLGYGPRFLHSTGQLHKGGPNNIVALQLTYDPDEDLPIPGEPYTFGTLIRAQALGDIESLRAHERRAMRIHLLPDILAGLRKVNNAIKAGSKPKSSSGRTRKARVAVVAE